MSVPPDLDELARRYVELWERQLAATATDAAMTAQLANAFTAMAQVWPMALQGLAAAAPVGGQSGDGKAGDGQGAGQTGGGATAAGPAGAATAAAAPGDGIQQLAELERRLAAVEERLAAVEARPRGRSGGAATGGRRRK